MRDWSTGKLSRYAVPPGVSGPGTASDADRVSPPTLATIYAGDDAALLERLLPRKELRRSRDVVRLSSERVVDDRALALDASWFDADGVDSGASDVLEDESEAGAIMSGEEDPADEAGPVGSAEEEEEDEDDNDEDAEGVEGEGEDGDEAFDPRSSFARKRKRPPPSSALSSSSKPQLGPPARPRKKVAFATTVKAISDSTRSSKEEYTLSRPSSTTKPSPSKKSNATAPTNPSRKSAGTAPPRARKSAANAPTMTRQKRKAAGGDDAYDFSKFF